MNRYNYRVKKIDNFIPDIPINEDSRDNLFSLATSHDIGGLEEFITTNSISLNVKNNNNQTIIHVLLDTENTTDEKDLLRCIKFLVNKGAYISNSDNFLLTPLFICIKKNYQYIFNYLLNEGANTNINTYDNLTVMHVLAQPGYITYDANGIQSIIPDKLPKFDMEKYKIIYNQIQDVLNLKSYEFKITLLDEIAKQFYYHDEKEDFNNKLLIEEYKEDLKNNKKTNIFEKIKNNLNTFYDNNEVQDVNQENLNNELNETQNELNNELNVNTMHKLNDNILNAIKNLALSLELSTHYFFLKDLENTSIATSVVISIAERAMAEKYNFNQLFYVLRNISVMREAIQAVKAVTIEAKRGGTKASDIINTIKKEVEYPTLQNYNNIGVGGIVYLAINNSTTAIAEIIKYPSNPDSLFTANAITRPVKRAAIIIPPFVRIVKSAFDALNAGNNHIQKAATNASYVVNGTSNIEINTRIAVNRAVTAVIVLEQPATIQEQVQVVTVVQASIRAAAYAAAYTQNKVLKIPLVQVSNLLAAVDGAIGAGVQRGMLQVAPVLVANQEKLQRALTDPVVAIEAVVNATYEAVAAAYIVILAAIHDNIITDAVGVKYIVEAIKEALQYIETSNVDIDTIIAIAIEAAKEEREENLRLQINAITIALTNKNKVRAAVESVKTASAVPGTNKKIIDVIRTAVAISVNVATETFETVYTAASTAANVLLEDTDPTVTIAVQTAMRTAMRTATVEGVDQFVIIVDEALKVVETDDNDNDIIQIIAKAISYSVIDIANIAHYTYAVVNTAITNVTTLAPPAIIQEQVQLVTILQAVIRACVYAALYTKNKVSDIPVSNLSAVYTVVDEAIVVAVQRSILQVAPEIAIVANQEELQRALTDPVVAIEAVINATYEAIVAARSIILPLVRNHTITNANGVVIIVEALKEALKLPPIIPEQFKNDDYNKLIKLYKLINIPQKYINYNISYKYPNNYIDSNIKQAIGLNNYKLPEGDITYSIDYFNLLYTFNEYVRDNYNPPAIINNIFVLYQCIQQIYKYNYIIYIFDKEKSKILKLKDNYIPKLNTGLKETINKLFDTNYYDLVRSVDIIKKQLETIKNIANNYIDNYNKLNGYKIYINSDANTNNIGIYPQIKFPTEIKHSLGDENTIIAKCNDYITYNKNKKDFFHNFVLYFQDIGIYQDPINPANLLNNIPIPINYNINITDYYTNDKNKANKLYFYDPIYLKLIKQYFIKNMLINNNIISIRTENQDIYNPTLSQKLDDNIKKTILNEILNNNFDIFLNNAIDNLLKEEVSLYPEPIIFEKTIEKPDFYAMLSESLGFSNILIPNYEFTNNKFLSISKNRFLKCILYFDTKYFEPTNISTLNYYKNNNIFIDKLL